MHNGLNRLFSKDGLGLAFCRTDFNETYGSSGTVNFEWDRPYNLPADHSSIVTTKFDNSNPMYHLLQQTGQKWVMSHLSKKYPNINYLYSTWSPPQSFKDSKKMNNGRLMREHFQDFATYMVDYMEGIYKVCGAYPVAISPTNEPNASSASWAACGWYATDLADFIVDYLRPELNKRGHEKVAIIVGEHAWWNSGNKYVQDVLEARPEITKMNIIAAGHGYKLIGNEPPEAYEAAVKAGIKVWNTETSDTSTFDGSWKNGMNYAKKFHDYLALANINVFMWWQGARTTTNNESLIRITDWNIPGTDYEKPEPMRYYTYGHFSKYIPIGSYRYATELKVEDADVNTQAFLDDLLITAYIDDVKNEYAIVIINENETDSKEIIFEIENLVIKNMQKYESIETYQWKKTKINPSEETSSRYTTILPYSITTLKGKIVTN